MRENDRRPGEVVLDAGRCGRFDGDESHRVARDGGRLVSLHHPIRELAHGSARVSSERPSRPESFVGVLTKTPCPVHSLRSLVWTAEPVARPTRRLCRLAVLLCADREIGPVARDVTRSTQRDTAGGMSDRPEGGGESAGEGVTTPPWRPRGRSPLNPPAKRRNRPGGLPIARHRPAPTDLVEISVRPRTPNVTSSREFESSVADSECRSITVNSLQNATVYGILRN